MPVGKSLSDRSRSVTETFAAVESPLRARAERMVKQAAENDLRTVKELGPFGQWIQNQTFPLLAPLIARELRRHKPLKISSLDMVDAAGVELVLSLESTRLAHSTIPRNSQISMSAKFAYKSRTNNSQNSRTSNNSVFQSVQRTSEEF